MMEIYRLLAQDRIREMLRVAERERLARLLASRRARDGTARVRAGEPEATICVPLPGHVLVFAVSLRRR
jgi:hypothetical protein